MGCAWAGKIRRLISGELSARTTRDVLDHMRGCERCREALESASSTAPTAARAPGDVPYERYTVEEVEAARTTVNPGRKRGMMALVMVIVLTTAAIVDAERKRSPGTADDGCRAALAEGRPWAISPFGSGPRPRQIRAVLPPGTKAFRVRLSRMGESIWEGRFAEGDPSVEIYATTGGNGEDEFDAVGAVAPFPSPRAVPLRSGVDYELRIITDDQKKGSDAIRFSIRGE